MTLRLIVPGPAVRTGRALARDLSAWRLAGRRAIVSAAAVNVFAATAAVVLCSEPFAEPLLAVGRGGICLGLTLLAAVPAAARLDAACSLVEHAVRNDPRSAELQNLWEAIEELNQRIEHLNARLRGQGTMFEAQSGETAETIQKVRTDLALMADRLETDLTERPLGITSHEPLDMLGRHVHTLLHGAVRAAHGGPSSG